MISFSVNFLSLKVVDVDKYLLQVIFIIIGFL